MSGEPEEAELPSDRRFRSLSQGFWILGFGCVVFGSLWAWQNSTTISEYPATAPGRLVDRAYYAYTVGGETYLSEHPTMAGGRLVDHSYHTYTVDGETYRAEAANGRHAPATVTIHYDPHDPEKHIVGDIAPPWVVLAFAFGLGAFLAFVGYEFR